MRCVSNVRALCLAAPVARRNTESAGMQVLEEGQLRLQVGVEAERRMSPVFGFGHGVAGGGGADQRVLGQASVEW